MSRQADRREIWEAAQAAGLDDVIAKVAAVFGVDDVAIDNGEGWLYLKRDPDQVDRVLPGVTATPEQRKELMTAHKKPNKHLKG